VQTADEKILVRVSGAFRSERDVLAVNFVAQNGRIIRLGDIARVTRRPADSCPADVPRQWTKRHRARHLHAHGGDVLALGRTIEQAMTEITANLPVGIEPTLVADQPVTVEHAVGRLHGGPVGGQFANQSRRRRCGLSSSPLSAA